MKNARKIPHGTKAEKELRAELIRLAPIKKESSSLIRRYGESSRFEPDERMKEDMLF